MKTLGALLVLTLTACSSIQLNVGLTEGREVCGKDRGLGFAALMAQLPEVSLAGLIAVSNGPPTSGSHQAVGTYEARGRNDKVSERACLREKTRYQWGMPP